MDTHRIISGILKQIDLTKAEGDFFSCLLQSKWIRQKHYLLEEGKVCTFNVFINTGCLKSFITDPNGFEHILSFAPEG